jgi:asparagine N-glycosylation enzyme membrane subunit Stt3
MGKKIWSSIWFIGAGVLLILAIEYTVVKILESNNAVPIILPLAILLVLLILFVVEGAEIAAVGLLDSFSAHRGRNLE